MSDRFFQDRLRDAASRALRDNAPTFLGFFDEHQAKEAAAFLGARTPYSVAFYGGYPSAERVMVGFFPSSKIELSLFPITAITAEFPAEYSVSHRDVLGSLMALGLQRETLGDILVEPGRAVTFCRCEIAPLVLQELDTIGGVGVRLQKGAQEPLPPLASFLHINDTISSPRLDCIVAVLARTSRGAAAELIKKELVAVNHTSCRLGNIEIKEDDILSIRGYGKFRIDSIGPLTRKGRLRFCARKYI